MQKEIKIKDGDHEYEDLLSKYHMVQTIIKDFRYNTNLDVALNTYANRIKEISKEK